MLPLRSSRSASAYQRRRCSGLGRFTASALRESSAMPSSRWPWSASDPAATIRPSVTSSGSGEAAASSSQSSSTLRHRFCARAAVHQHRVLLDRVRELDERLELRRRRAVVAEPVLRQTGQLPDARRVGQRIAYRSQDADRLVVAVVRVRVGGFHEPVEEVLPAAPAQAQDLGLDVAGHASTASLRRYAAWRCRSCSLRPAMVGA